MEDNQSRPTLKFERYAGERVVGRDEDCFALIPVLRSSLIRSFKVVLSCAAMIFISVSSSSDKSRVVRINMFKHIQIFMSTELSFLKTFLGRPGY